MISLKVTCYPEKACIKMNNDKKRLAEYVDTLANEACFWAQGLKNPDTPFSELGRLSLELSTIFKQLSIVVLLLNDDSKQFHYNLIRSGLTRETYLARCIENGFLFDHHRASGRYEPLMNVIATNHFDSARRIAKLSPKEWLKGHEYEDDYCYAQIFHRFIQENPPEIEIIALIDQFESYLQGEANTRFEICKALSTRNQKAFDRAFDALLDEKESTLLKEIKRGSITPIGMVTEQVFIEGLAILRVAERRELHTEIEYKYCPSRDRESIQKPIADF